MYLYDKLTSNTIVVVVKCTIVMVVKCKFASLIFDVILE